MNHVLNMHIENAPICSVSIKKSNYDNLLQKKRIYRQYNINTHML